VPKTSLDLTIQGNIVFSDHVGENKIIGIKNGKIKGFFDNQTSFISSKHINAEQNLIFPGLVDAHVHSYSNLKEGFGHSTAAAAAGGVTTIIEMPYDQNEPVVTADVFKKKIDKIHRLAKVDVALLATLKKDGNSNDISSIARLGACGFKLSTFETDPDRFPRIEDDILYEIFPKILEQGLTVGFHAENDRIIESLISRYNLTGKTYPRAHLETRPPVTETIAVIKLLELAYWLPVRLHIYHVSHPRTIDLIDWYRTQGVDVSGETCPHYLVFTEKDLDKKRSFLKINPPIRSKAEVEQMWNALQEDRIDFVTTDHAPWPLSKKQSENIFENASGAPGLEIFLSVMYTHGVVERGLKTYRLAQLLSENPAKRFNLIHRKGRIALGADADLTIFDPTIEWRYDAKKSLSSAKWSPYDGNLLKGKVVKTIVRGKIAYDGQSVIAKPGEGKFIPAK
jgi:allantoinase